jgi:hypothetical protein
MRKKDPVRQRCRDEPLGRDRVVPIPDLAVISQASVCDYLADINCCRRKV